MFEPFLVEVYNSYQNLNIFLERSTEYNPLGRNQTYEEAIAIDRENIALLEKHGIDIDVCVDLTHANWKENLVGFIKHWNTSE
ncbi:hypothetical protein D3C73_674070 [compost metagenome]